MPGHPGSGTAVLRECSIRGRLLVQVAPLLPCRRILGTVFAIPGNQGVQTVKQDDVVICRCEEVTLRELQEAIAKGAATSRQLKLETRIGMGYCQGRTCRPLVAQLVPDEPDASSLTYRPPCRPITFGQLAGEGQK